MSDTEVELELEMRGPDHVDEFLSALRDAGYEVDVLA
jgi:threonine dehydratase